MSKLDAQKIAGRYAKALYEAAVEQGQIDAVQADMAALASVFAKTPELTSYLSAPLVSDADKAALVSEQFLSKLQSTVTQNTLKLILESQRIGLLETIVESFTLIVQEAKGIVDADVTVAGPTPEATLKRLQAQLEKLFHLKEVRLNVQEDPDILAGAVVRIRGKVLDGSYQNKLQQVRQHVR